MRFNDVFPNYESFEAQIINASSAPLLNILAPQYFYYRLRDYYESYIINYDDCQLPKFFVNAFLRKWEKISLDYQLKFKLAISDYMSNLSPEQLMYNGTRSEAINAFENRGDVAHLPSGKIIANDDVSDANENLGVSVTKQNNNQDNPALNYAVLMAGGFYFPIEKYVNEFALLFYPAGCFGQSIIPPEPPVVSGTSSLPVDDPATESLTGNATNQQEVNREFVAAINQQQIINSNVEGDINVINDQIVDIQNQIDNLPVVVENDSVILWPNDVSKILPYNNGVKNTYSINPSIFTFKVIAIRYHITDADSGNETQTELMLFTNSLDINKPMSFAVSNYRLNTNTNINSFGSVWIQFNAAGTSATIWQEGILLNTSTNHNAQGFLSLDGWNPVTIT